MKPPMARPLTKFVDRLLSRSEVSTASRKALLAIDAPIKSCKARWDLVRTGQRVDYACLVADGVIGRSEQFADGRRRTVAIYVAGDMCDLHSVAVPAAAWNLTALTECRYYQVPHTGLHACFDAHEDVAMALWRDTVADASMLAKLAAVLSGLGARERVAHVLCEYGIRIEAAGLGSRSDFPLPLTQSQLAELVGTTPVHMSRIVRSLATEAALEQHRGNIAVRDLAMLERIADFDPTYLLFRENSPLAGRRRA